MPLFRPMPLKMPLLSATPRHTATLPAPLMLRTPLLHAGYSHAFICHADDGAIGWLPLTVATMHDAVSHAISWRR